MNARWIRWSFAGACGLGLVLLLQCQSSADAAARNRGLQSWNLVYQVLEHPRCKNCHPAGDVPLQGDEGRPHGQGVQRGADGQGLFAMRCDSCHQDHNLDAPGLPPGAPRWSMPQKATPMVFEGRSSAELARQLADPLQNGKRTPEQMWHHMAEDALVGWGWQPGEGRKPVPIPRADVANAFKTWIDAGCPVP
jgi:hypothetical protein